MDDREDEPPVDVQFCCALHPMQFGPIGRPFKFRIETPAFGVVDL